MKDVSATRSRFYIFFLKSNPCPDKHFSWRVGLSLQAFLGNLQLLALASKKKPLVSKLPDSKHEWRESQRQLETVCERERRFRFHVIALGFLMSGSCDHMMVPQVNGLFSSVSHILSAVNRFKACVLCSLRLFVPPPMVFYSLVLQSHAKELQNKKRKLVGMR